MSLSNSLSCLLPFGRVPFSLYSFTWRRKEVAASLLLLYDLKRFVKRYGAELVRSTFPRSCKIRIVNCCCFTIEMDIMPLYCHS